MVSQRTEPSMTAEDTSWRVTRIGLRGDPRVAELALDTLRKIEGVHDVSIHLSCATVLGTPNNEELLTAVR